MKRRRASVRSARDSAGRRKKEGSKRLIQPRSGEGQGKSRGSREMPEFLLKCAKFTPKSHDESFSNRPESTGHGPCASGRCCDTARAGGRLILRRPPSASRASA